MAEQVGVEPVVFFSNGHQLAGDLYTPDGPEPGGGRPGIVLCQGYTAIKDMFLPDTARALNRAGYLVLAFDYTGWGESAGPRHRLAPHGRVADTSCALSFLAERPEVDAARLGLMGWSYGGATAIWTAAVDARVRAVVSAGGVGDGERWMRSARSPEEWRALQEHAAADSAARMRGAPPRTVPRGEMLKLDAESARLSAQARKGSAGASDELALSFVEETLAFNPEWVVERIAPRAALFITGAEDRVVPAAESRALHARAGAPKRLVEIAGCAHYDIYGGAPFARAMDEAASWFDAHLAAE